MDAKKDISKEIQKELDELSPKLAGISKKHPYTVPEGYFESLSNRAAEIAQDHKVQRQPIIRKLISARNVAVAASITLIAITFWMNNFNEETGQKDIATIEATVDEMIAYLEDESSEGFDEYELVEELLDIDEMIAVEEDIDDLDPTTEDIIEYLLDDNIDLATIIDELN